MRRAREILCWYAGTYSLLKHGKKKLDATPFHPLLCFDSSLRLCRARAAHSAATGWRTSIFVGLLKKNCSFKSQISDIYCTCMLNAPCDSEVILCILLHFGFIRESNEKATAHDWQDTEGASDLCRVLRGPPSSRHCSWLICKQNPLVHAWCSWLWDTSEESRCSGYTQRMGVSCPWKESPETLASSAPAIWALSSQSCERQSEHSSGMESAGRLWFAPLFFFFYLKAMPAKCLFYRIYCVERMEIRTVIFFSHGHSNLLINAAAHCYRRHSAVEQIVGLIDNRSTSTWCFFCCCFFSHFVI